jgi:hypothetical protein
VAALTVEALRATCDNLTRQGLMDAVHTIFKDYQGVITLPGIALLSDIGDQSRSNYIALAALAGAALVALGAGAWYARKRWSR